MDSLIKKHLEEELDRVFEEGAKEQINLSSPAGRRHISIKIVEKIEGILKGVNRDDSRGRKG